MDALILIIVILLATVILVGVGDRFNLPWPVLLTLLTTGVILVPNLPNLDIEPEIILPLFLPPLLWAIGARVTWGSLRRGWRSVLVYSVLLTAVSAFAVAVSAWILIPGMTFALALAIGAAVAPPDPVAVEAVAEPVGIPHRVIGVLQTEGIFNDAVSLVLFQAALAVLIAGGDISPIGLVGSFFYSAIVAVLVGFAVGTLSNIVARNISDTVARSAITLVVPFAVYLMTERLNASGVIAVVIAAIQMNSYKIDAFTAEDRMVNHSFWRVIELLITGLAFGLIGLQAGELIYETDNALVLEAFWNGVILSAVAVTVRLLWMSANWLIGRVQNNERATPRTFAEVLVMTWAGMRGLVTLALALTLPEVAGDMRTESIIIVITVLFFTMVFPGLTLPTLVKVLGVGVASEKDDKAELELMTIAQKAAIDSLKVAAKNSSPETLAQVTEMCQGMVHKVEDAHKSAQFQNRLHEMQKYREEVNQVRKVSISAAQSAVLAQRNHYDLEVVNSVLLQLDSLQISSTARENSITLALAPLTTGVMNISKYRKLVEHEVETKAIEITDQRLKDQ